MTFNSFGYMYKFSTWGESHGSSIGCIVDGVPSCIDIHESYIQEYVKKRRPGYSSVFATSRKESDKVEILSGVFDGKTTGAPISVIIKNEDCRSADYDPSKYRPGHADFLYFKKYGNYDYRGGGRASGRETACRVIAGSIARKIISDQIEIRGVVTRIGDIAFQGANIDWVFASSNVLFCPDPILFTRWSEYLKDIVISGDSVGALCEIEVTGVPIGLGEPVYKKLDAYIAEAIMGINAVKSVEIGIGKDCSGLRGSDYIDEMVSDTQSRYGASYLSNNSGGIIGGISNGMPIKVKFSVKPTGSIALEVKTVNNNLEDTLISTKGRHDPCIGVRIIPVAEAMIACVLADLTLISRTKS